MAMEKRATIVLKRRQIEKACEESMASRLLPDEEAIAVIDFSGDDVTCEISLSKKRKPRERKPRTPKIVSEVIELHDAAELKCPHGELPGECDACDQAGDFAFDAAREARMFPK